LWFSGLFPGESAVIVSLARTSRIAVLAVTHGQTAAWRQHPGDRGRAFMADCSLPSR
jgi:hypothetical protein